MEPKSPVPPPDRPAVPAAPALSRAERRERAVADALRTLIRDLHLDRFGAGTAKLMSDAIAVYCARAK